MHALSSLAFNMFHIVMFVQNNCSSDVEKSIVSYVRHWLALDNSNDLLWVSMEVKADINRSNLYPTFSLVMLDETGRIVGWKL